VSLSQDPAFSLLKKYFVCGYKDITNEPYAGVSGRHEVGGNAIDTSNGAGPHNLQLFFLAADGTVLSVLPGYWHSEDMYPEMQLASKLNQVWLNRKLSRAQKNQMFQSMQLAHIQEHSPEMVKRSRMQGFDMKYEAEHRLATSDTIADRQLAYAAIERGQRMVPPAAFKTTDVIMHERMAARPFEPYSQFDVASFADYGKTKYDKNEDMRLADGSVDRLAIRNKEELGNPQALAAEHPNRQRMQQNRERMQQMAQMQDSQRDQQRLERRQMRYSGAAWGNGNQWGNGYRWGNGGS
jgi:hypothetical protein